MPETDAVFASSQTQCCFTAACEMVSYEGEASVTTWQPIQKSVQSIRCGIRSGVWQGSGGSVGGRGCSLHQQGQVLSLARSAHFGEQTSEMALTSWPTASSSSRLPLLVFAEVMDQNQYPQGDEKIRNDDPCHSQGIQLLTVCAHCQEGIQKCS